MPLLQPGDCFSHVTAAQIWRLPVPLEMNDEPLHVLTPGRRSVRRPGVVGHSAETAPFSAALRGVVVVDPVHAWIQCASLIRLDDLIAMGDALLGEWSPYPAARLRDVAELQVEADRWGRRRGAAALREALETVRPGVMSPKETELRLLVQRAGLPEPALNADVFDGSGRWLGCSDLVYQERRVAVEYEGDHHRVDRRQWQSDVERLEAYADAGWRLLRVTQSHLYRPAPLLARLQALLLP